MKDSDFMDMVSGKLNGQKVRAPLSPQLKWRKSYYVIKCSWSQFTHFFVQLSKIHHPCLPPEELT